MQFESIALDLIKQMFTCPSGIPPDGLRTIGNLLNPCSRWDSLDFQ